MRALSDTGGTVQVYLDRMDGPLVAEVDVPKGNEWKTSTASLSSFHRGVHNLFVMLKDDAKVEMEIYGLFYSGNWS